MSSSRRNSSSRDQRRPSSNSRQSSAPRSILSNPFTSSQPRRSSRGPEISNPYTYAYRTRSGSTGRARTSAYKRSPRSGFISSVWRKIQKFVRTILSYMRAHPFKIVLPIIMALISGGALTALAAKVGLGALGKNIENLVGAGQSVRGGYDAWYGSQDVGGGGAAGGGFNGSGFLRGAAKVAAGFL